MLLKGLYAGSIGLVFLTLAFVAPSAWGVATASPEPVKPTVDNAHRSGSSTRTRTRGPRYVFVGGYTRGK